MSTVNDVPHRLGTEVIDGVVDGHPCRVFRDRLRNVDELTREGRRWSDRTFIVHGDRRFGFDEVDRAVARCAARLVDLGIVRGDRVGLLAANSAEWAVVFFAALRLGAIAVPCNGWWSSEEVAHGCSVVDPAIVVCDERRAERVPAGVRQVRIEGFADCLDGTASPADPAGSPPVVDEDEVAVILFTSGTTGFPRGVALTHRALLANIQNFLVISRKLPHQLPDDHEPSVTLASLPLFHIGAIQLLLMPFTSGSTIVFPEGRFDPAEVLRLIDREGVTMWSAVPTMVQRVLDLEAPEGLVPDSLRTVVLGGAPVATDLLDRLAERFPNAARRVGRAYGLSEAGGVVATGVSGTLEGRPGASGRVMPTAEVRIAEPDEAGVGEIFVRSPTVMRGYWGQPEDDSIDADGWLRTGDLGRLDEDGLLYVTGRLKDLIIRGGENIAPAHIENRLLAHPDVDEAAVVGLPHPDLGEEVAAAVVLGPAADATASDLEAHCRLALAHFEVPARWWLRDAPLPKNTSGKVLKRDLLREWPAAPAAART